MSEREFKILVITFALLMTFLPFGCVLQGHLVNKFNNYLEEASEVAGE